MQQEHSERRAGFDRREQRLAAYWHGARNPRRRSGRRLADRIYPIVDWHSPRVLALVFAILALCVCDGVLTIVLMSHGAVELNPLLQPLLPQSLGLFAALKLGLTATGALVLVICSRMRLFRILPGETLLYFVLGCYVVLIFHQLRMLEVAPIAN
jgi:hypothetical protein